MKMLPYESVTVKVTKINENARLQTSGYSLCGKSNSISQNLNATARVIKFHLKERGSRMTTVIIFFKKKKKTLWP